MMIDCAMRLELRLRLATPSQPHRECTLSTRSSHVNQNDRIVYGDMATCRIVYGDMAEKLHWQSFQISNKKTARILRTAPAGMGESHSPPRHWRGIKQTTPVSPPLPPLAKRPPRHPPPLALGTGRPRLGSACRRTGSNPVPWIAAGRLTWNDGQPARPSPPAPSERLSMEPGPVRSGSPGRVPRWRAR